MLAVRGRRLLLRVLSGRRLCSRGLTTAAHHVLMHVVSTVDRSLVCCGATASCACSATTDAELKLLRLRVGTQLIFLLARAT